MSSVYQSDALKPDAVSKEILKGMGEDPAQKFSQIEAIRSWILSHNFMQCRTDDEFILKFLRVAKFSCEAAKERIQKFCLMRSSKLDGVPEWFADQSVADGRMKEILSSGMVYMMPRPDNLGRLILVFDMTKMMKVKMTPVEMIRAVYLVFDWMIFSFDRSQINGYVFIEIGSNDFDMEHMKYWTPERMKKSVDVWQGAMPMRSKIIHYYNMSAIMKGLIELALKFMKPKMAKRLKFHTGYKPDADLPAECIPPSLGGTGPAAEDVMADMLREMENFQSEYDSFKMCKVDDAKMPKKYEDGDSWGISGTYRNIAKDD